MKRFLVCFGLLCFFAGCAGRHESVPQGSMADLDTYSQNIWFYTEKVGLSERLLSALEQQRNAARWKQRFFAPWGMKCISVPAKDVRAMAGRKNKPRGYAENLLPWDAERWEQVFDRMALESYPSQAFHGIVVRHSSLRALPTHRPVFRNPQEVGQGYPFDSIQQSAVWHGTPVFIGHASRDGSWLYVETAFAAGWIPAIDVARVSPQLSTSYQKHALLAFTADDVALRVLQKGAQGAVVGNGHLGMVLPMIHNPATKLTASYGLTPIDSVALMPLRDAAGAAYTVEVGVRAMHMAIMPLALTPGNVALLSDKLLGKLYGWGGLYENRDCSAMLRDLFTPFGIWLPRHSRAQANAGKFISFAEYPVPEREERILSQGIPFRTLLWLPGHIALYIGEDKGRAMMFHTMWGIRTRIDGQDGRHVIGRAVITSTQPGLDVPGNASSDSLLGRMRGMTIIGGS